MFPSCPLPEVPDEMLDRPGRFVPIDGMDEFVRSAILDEEGPLHNPDHVHLRKARIGYLWTTEDWRDGESARIGQAGRGQPDTRNRWTSGILEQQYRSWWGRLTDFIVWFDAAWWSTADERSRLMVLEHELYHCGQARDDWGTPRYSRMTGDPIFTIKRHDVEEFIGVVRRYGASGPVLDLVEAVTDGPEISMPRILGACGCGAVIRG